MTGLMNDGDYVLVASGPMHVVGRVGVGAALLLAPVEGVVTLDVCILGTHLPQMYRPAECAPLGDVGPHGLCPTCRGWGLTELDPAGTLDDVLNGKAGTVCDTCGGSGRLGVHVTVTRDAGVVTGEIAQDPTAGDVTCDLCRAAYQPTH